jgi:hypothetical protein
LHGAKVLSFFVYIVSKQGIKRPKEGQLTFNTEQLALFRHYWFKEYRIYEVYHRISRNRYVNAGM